MYDALLYFGNFLKAFSKLHSMSFEDIADFFKDKDLIQRKLLMRGTIENPQRIQRMIGS